MGTMAEIREMTIHDYEKAYNNEIGNRFWNGTGWIRRDNIFIYSRNI